MTVSIILAGKGREVVTIEPGASLAAAVKLLAEKRIGAVLILGADRRIAGILSERDIVRALAERGAEALHEPVSGAMTRRVSTCHAGETISAIMERMTAGKLSHVPVVDQGRLARHRVDRRRGQAPLAGDGARPRRHAGLILTA